MNFSIYMGDKKTDSIACPNQMRFNRVYINDLPKVLFPEQETAQTIIADDMHMLLHFNRPFGYLNIWRPTSSEVSNNDLQRIEPTSPHGHNIPTKYTHHHKPFHVYAVSSFLSNPLRSLFILSTSKNRTITSENLMRL